jgi:hypothetical protein
MCEELSIIPTIVRCEGKLCEYNAISCVERENAIDVILGGSIANSGRAGKARPEEVSFEPEDSMIYDVLLIPTQDGTAYRVGIGQMKENGLSDAVKYTRS